MRRPILVIIALIMAAACAAPRVVIHAPPLPLLPTPPASLMAAQP